MPEKFPRSPYDAIGGLVYFLRMIDKIRLHAEGALPTNGYTEHLGGGFDGRCLRFLGLAYEEVKSHVLAGETDEAIFAWALAHGRKPSEDDIEVWSGFMMKRGWRDEARERVTFRITEAGLEARAGEIVTMFDFIDVDEGRTPPDFSKLMPPRV